MGLFVRILLGGLIVFAFVWTSILLLSLLAIWSPWPRDWWAHHPYWVFHGSQALVLVPSVIALGLLLSKLYRRHAVLSALASVTLALLVAFADSLTDPKALMVLVRETWTDFAPFLFGPPLVVALVEHLRSNNRWSGP